MPGPLHALRTLQRGGDGRDGAAARAGAQSTPGVPLEYPWSTPCSTPGVPLEYPWSTRESVLSIQEAARHFRREPSVYPLSTQRVPREYPESTQRVPGEYPESTRRVPGVPGEGPAARDDSYSWAINSPSP